MDDQIAQPITPDAKPALIEEPPLKNQKSCLRRGCSWLFSCFLLAVIAFLLIGWFWSEPGTQRLAALPANFPTDIPLYKFEERAGIYYLPSSNKDTIFQRLARLPKLTLNYLLYKINPDLVPETINEKGETAPGERLNWNELGNILQKSPSKIYMDTITITWEKIDEREINVYRFFERNLKKQDYAVTMLSKNTDLNFQKEKVTGRLTIAKSSEQKNAVDFSLRVDYSADSSLSSE
ncbi:MAG: hypothetical protein AAB849_02690 [Patescibacteria group bacterium]